MKTISIYGQPVKKFLLSIEVLRSVIKLDAHLIKFLLKLWVDGKIDTRVIQQVCDVGVVKNMNDLSRLDNFSISGVPGVGPYSIEKLLNIAKIARSEYYENIGSNQRISKGSSNSTGAN